MRRIGTRFRTSNKATFSVNMWTYFMDIYKRVCARLCVAFPRWPKFLTCVTHYGRKTNDDDNDNTELTTLHICVYMQLHTVRCWCCRCCCCCVICVACIRARCVCECLCVHFMRDSLLLYGWTTTRTACACIVPINCIRAVRTHTHTHAFYEMREILAMWVSISTDP